MTLTQGLVWFGAIALVVFLVWRRFPEACGKVIALGGKKAGAAEKAAPPPSPPFAGALLDAATRPMTWFLWILLFLGATLYVPKLMTTLNPISVIVFLWALAIFFSKASDCSKYKNPGDNKKPDPVLGGMATVIKRVAIISTLGAIAYYGFIAPTGTWEKFSGLSGVVRSPEKMVIPEGIPLNPTFTAGKLEGWTATYIAANVHYRVPQAAWRGKRLLLSKEPARELTEVADLTISFGPGNEALDIRLIGSCQARSDNRRSSVSKTCAGDWKDRGSQISGKFYLEVKEGGGGQRYFDAYLYDGNNIPRKGEIAMFLSGAPIPHVMLQFRPKEWSAENQ